MNLVYLGYIEDLEKEKEALRKQICDIILNSCDAILIEDDYISLAKRVREIMRKALEELKK